MENNDLKKWSLSMNDILKKIPSNIARAINEENQVYLQQLVKRSVRDLQQIARLDVNEANQLLLYISKIVLAKSIIPVSEVKASGTITTGCSSIDTVLKGGISLNGITEIYGESGVGKSQICLQLCLTVQTIINSDIQQKEDVFPSQRLHQLAKLLPLRITNFGTQLKLEDNVFIAHVADFKQLNICLDAKLPRLLKNRAIGLIIIDSIAGAFRSENENINYSERSLEFLTVASKLNKLGQKYEAAIVCINQVTDNITTGKSEACLGLAWKNLVSHRLYVCKLHNQIRKMEVIFSPYLKGNECHFTVKDTGVVNA
ncbi:DNA repair protein XRCC3-like isoform X2 [Agrilus planipennis]|uniref:DNA repair protein XRCC3-like isoform X2 n=1 Tax=Agrilus planipennis TaxID=224129 RepID=A0A1W4X3I7_AGRPL|nr:DNA repair protein XRCC3-like isoform X2 [Agrilus planipennis]